MYFVFLLSPSLNNNEMINFNHRLTKELVSYYKLGPLGRNNEWWTDDNGN